MSVFFTHSYVVALSERFKAISSLGGGVMPSAPSQTGSVFGDLSADIEPPFSWEGALIAVSTMTAISATTFAVAVLWRLA